MRRLAVQEVLHQGRGPVGRAAIAVSAIFAGQAALHKGRMHARGGIAQPLQVQACQPVSVELDVAAVWIVEALYELNARRFATAAETDQSDRLVWTNLKADVLQSGLTGCVRITQGPNLNRR